jgi:hypothetical protein
MQVFVNTVRGRSIVVECEAGWSVAQLKRAVEDREGVPVAEQRLVFGGKELADDRTLSDYCIGAESTVYLVLRLRGGTLACRCK